MKIHFGSSVSCKCNIYFGWSLEIQVIYMKKGCGSLYTVKMFLVSSHYLKIISIHTYTFHTSFPRCYSQYGVVPSKQDGCTRWKGRVSYLPCFTSHLKYSHRFSYESQMALSA